MNRIDPRRLRLLLQNHLYRTAAVKASTLGGWFVQRPSR